jgi:hypothetical protein
MNILAASSKKFSAPRFAQQSKWQLMFYAATNLCAMQQTGEGAPTRPPWRMRSIGGRLTAPVFAG